MSPRNIAGLEPGEYAEFFGLGADAGGELLAAEDGGGGAASGKGGASMVEVLYIPNFLRHVRTLEQDYGISAGALDKSTLKCTVWRVLMNYLWRTKYRTLYGIHFLLYLSYCALSLGYLVMHQRPRLSHAEGGLHPGFRLAHAGLVCAWNVSFLGGELGQLREEGLQGYFASGWNFIQFVNYCTFLAVVGLDTVLPEEKWEEEWLAPGKYMLRILMSIGALTAVTNILYYARGIGGVGVVVRMVTSIVAATFYFMVVLVLFCAAFTLAFWFLADEKPAEDPSEGRRLKARGAGEEVDVGAGVGVGDVLIAVFNGGLGEFVHVEEFYGPRFAYPLWLLYVCFTFITTVVMLNLLIAIMGNEYAAIEEREEIEATREGYAIMEGVDSSTQTRLAIWLGLVPRHMDARYLVVGRGKASRWSWSSSGTTRSRGTSRASGSGGRRSRKRRKVREAQKTAASQTSRTHILTEGGEAPLQVSRAQI